MKFLLPFMNDSSLIFAASLREKLRARGHEALAVHFTENEEPDVSERQMATIMPEGPDLDVAPNFFAGGSILDFDAVITSMPSRYVRERLDDEGFRNSRTRPAYLAFYAGLDLTPEKGFPTRRHYDAVFLTQRGHVDRFNAKVGHLENRHVSFGHPYFMRPTGTQRTGKSIVFFAQASQPIDPEFPSLPSRRALHDC